MDKFTNENIINEQISSVLNSKIDILQFPNNFCARTNDLVNYLESDRNFVNHSRNSHQHKSLSAEQLA